MTNRSDRGSNKPRGAERFERVDLIRDSICGLHQGSSHLVLREQAEQMDAPDQVLIAAQNILHHGGRPHMLPIFPLATSSVRLHAIFQGVLGESVVLEHHSAIEQEWSAGKNGKKYELRERRAKWAVRGDHAKPESRPASGSSSIQ